jgi:hypothetical protein
VDPEEPVDREPFEQAVVDHGAGSPAWFLGGLVDDADRPVEPVLLGQ